MEDEMAKSRIEDQALGRVKEQIASFVDEELPKLAEAMHAASSEQSHKGKLTLCVEWAATVDTETGMSDETLRVTSQLATPKHASDQLKVVWESGQMTLL